MLATGICLDKLKLTTVIPLHRKDDNTIFVNLQPHINLSCHLKKFLTRYL